MYNSTISDSDMAQLRNAINQINKRFDKAINVINQEIAEKQERVGQKDPLEVYPVYYWAPRMYEFEGGEKIVPGFTMYICGGDAFHLYLQEGKIQCEIFDKTYDRYFKNARLLRTYDKKNKKGESIPVQIIENPIREKFMSLCGTKKKYIKAEGYARLVHAEEPGCLTDAEILEIVYAFIAVVKGVPESGIFSLSGRTKKPYERYRENIIAHDNCKAEKYFQIINMEFEERLGTFSKRKDGKSIEDKGKADLVGISLDRKEKKATIYFIEYKCTETATAGKASLPKHFQDMAKYFRSDYVCTKVLQMYENQMKLLNKEREIPEDIEKYLVDSYIVFLFSHICEGGKNNQYVKKDTVASKVIQMMNDNGKRSYDTGAVGYLIVTDFDKGCILGDNIRFFKDKFLCKQDVIDLLLKL